MMPHQFRAAILVTSVLIVSACAPAPQFHWGSYENSLYARQQHAGAQGETEAATMLLATINDAQAANKKVGPGIHADYGMLLFKQGKADEAIGELQKEATLYPEAKPLMETMVSRIQGRKDNKPTP